MIVDAMGWGWISFAPMRDTLLVIHILAAATWFGTNMVQVAVNPGIAKKGAVIAASWHRTLLSLIRLVYTPAAIVSLGTGVLLLTAVENTVYEFSDTFVSIGFLMIIFGSVMGVAFFSKRSAAAADAYDAGDLEAAATAEKQIMMGGILDTVLMILTVAVMVSRWS